MILRWFSVTKTEMSVCQNRTNCATCAADFHVPLKAGSTISFNCDGIEGTLIKMSKRPGEKRNILVACEVEAFGFRMKEKPTWLPEETDGESDSQVRSFCSTGLPFFVVSLSLQVLVSSHCSLIISVLLFFSVSLWLHVLVSHFFWCKRHRKITFGFLEIRKWQILFVENVLHILA